MSEILVDDLEDAVIEQLEACARVNCRSLQAELKLILEQAARPAPARLTRAEYRVLAEQIRASVGSRRQADSAALLPEGRAR